MEATSVTKENGGLRVVGYGGDNKILLAMSLADDMVNEADKNLAGFAIWRTPEGKPERALGNRIGFDVGVTKNTAAKDHKWTDSDKAPFQKFRWIDVPPDGFAAPITYRVKALFFSGQGSATTDGPEVTITVEPPQQRHQRFHPAFTRGCIASQAYADKFQNKDIRPQGPKTPDFETKPFEAQYEWLGADARTRLFAFLADCENDKQCKVDVLAYDLDEPDVVAALCRLGRDRRLRAILDNASLHVKPNTSGELPPEVKSAKLIIGAAGPDNVKQGKFSRFQHNKVLIKRDHQGHAQRVLFGSMNFSVRGLYVQANNVIVVDDPHIAGLFATAFDVAFAGDVKAAPFRQDEISGGYKVGADTDSSDLPKSSLAFSPHTDWHVSLGPMADRMRAATSSVLFAVMAPTGKGPILTTLKEVAAEPTVFSYGTVETDKGLAVQSPDGAMGDITSFAALTKNVPAPFTKEFGGGPGMHIHDKFVVVDFNADNPTVFTGSSNLASGGEEANGDNLIMIQDAAVANMFAIEAVALFDHYHFRKAMKKGTKAKPLTLWYPGKPGAPQPWWKQYYDRSQIQMRDRYLFAGLPLPPGMATTKKVDWKAVDAAAAKKSAPKKSGQSAGVKKKPQAKRTTAKKAPAKKKARAKKPARKKGSAKRKQSSAKRATPKKAKGKRVGGAGKKRR
jgi:phosphatidylserine/phosphatidylglycerophosphate/cardiolipin synthase-like enzyme